MKTEIRSTNNLRQALGGEVPTHLHSTAILLCRNLPNDVHAMFKSKCARRGRTMRGIILACMKDINGGPDSQTLIHSAALANRYPEPK